MILLIHKVEKEGDPLMKLSNDFNVISKLTRVGAVNNTLNIINKLIKDYEITSFNTSYFS